MGALTPPAPAAAQPLFEPDEIGWLLVEADALLARAGRRGAVPGAHRQAGIFARLATDTRLRDGAAQAAGAPQRLRTAWLLRGGDPPPPAAGGVLYAAVDLGGGTDGRAGRTVYAPAPQAALGALAGHGAVFLAAFEPGLSEAGANGGLWPTPFVCGG
ncbi:hypothetical protein [Marinimicrococcus flavescens]|uniref:Uncharacterized protein n=1 Tax=Marinimicrococcus flavescens TaxID=3031815 RepID=A0AAP3XS12_9PROT|nr:hypothetical protein [Marinimicrococcus flavescens]